MVKKGKPKFLPRAAPAGGFPLRSGVAIMGRGGREVEEKGIVKYWKRTHFTQKNGAGPHGTKWENIFFTSGSAA